MHNHTANLIKTSIRVLASMVLVLSGANRGAAVEENPKSAWNDYLQHLKKTKGVVDIRLIHDSGSGSNAFNLMVVSAGFSASDGEIFYKDCNTLSRSLFYDEPWKKYKNLVNIYGVFVDDQSPDKTRVQVAGYKGQILNCQNQPAIEFANFAGKSDATVVVHNSNFSTPTCGPWAMVTCNRSTTGNYLTLHHELGHSIGGLGDKYTQRPGRYDGSIKNLWEGKNATDQPNPLLCQWHYWTQDIWPGIFTPLKLPKRANVINKEGAAWATGFYRPEDKCLMHGGDSPAYCTICTEIMESCFFRTINLFEAVSPASGDRVLWKGESETFNLKALKFIRESRPWLVSRIELHVDGKQVVSSSNGTASFTFGGKMATPGYHQIGANLDVQSEFVRRDDGFLGASRAWRVKVMPYEKPKLTLPQRVTVQQGKPIKVPITIEHSRKDLVSIQLSHAPEGAGMQSGVLEWLASKPGAWQVDFMVSVDKQEAFTQSLEIIVTSNDPQVGALEIKTLNPVDALVGKQTTLQIEATSDKGSHLLYQLINPEEGMNLDRTTGKLTWTPRVDQYGPHRLRFRVSNGSATREGDVLIGVCNEAAPYLNSYLTTYNKDRNKWLKEHKESPFIYEKIFEISRMFRERFSDIYSPALDEAKAIYPGFSPGMREAFLQEMARYAWTFVDRPAILEWLTVISKGGATQNERNLQANLNAIRIWRKVMDTELAGNPEHLGPLLKQLTSPNHVAVHSAIRRALKALYNKTDDKDAFRSEVSKVMQKSKGPELAAILPLLPSIEMPGKEGILLKVALDPNEEVSQSALDAMDKLTATSTPAEISAFSKILITNSDKKQRVVISKILSSICAHVKDRNKIQDAMLDLLDQTKGPGYAQLLQLLPLVNEPKLVDLLKRVSTSTDSELAGTARKIQKYLQDEIGSTDAFVASWKLSGPYPIEGDNTVFAPEKGESAEWKDYQCPEKSGPRKVPLDSIFRGDNRVAYMKVGVRSDKKQNVMFGAGSDDGIEVWLNGKSIYSLDALRAVTPDQDQFTGTLNAGENVILCKIKQYSQGWGGCLSIRSENGGPALGVSVVP